MVVDTLLAVSVVSTLVCGGDGLSADGSTEAAIKTRPGKVALPRVLLGSRGRRGLSGWGVLMI
jgi:hypothetical protein